VQRIVWILLTVVLAAAPGATQSRSGVVSGQLRKPDGTPASGVRVMATEEADGAAKSLIVSATQTDASGRYQLDGVPPGRYHISAGILAAPTFYPGVAAAGAATLVTVGAGATVSGVDFPVPQRSIGLRLSGRLAPGENLIQKPDRVFLRPLNDGSTDIAALFGAMDFDPLVESRIVAVSPQGEFEFRELPAGAYILRSNATGSLARMIILDDDNVTGVELGVHSMLSLTTRTVVRQNGPLPLYTLLLASPQGDFAVEITPGADGVASISVPSGRYRLTAKALAGGYAPDGFIFGNENLKNADIDIGAFEDRALTVTFVPSSPAPGRKISGRINEMRRNVAPGGRVKLQGPNLAPMWATAKPDGVFEFPTVFPGTYAVLVDPSPLGSSTATVTITDRDIANVELRVPELVEMRGRVIVDGNPNYWRRGGNAVPSRLAEVRFGVSPTHATFGASLEPSPFFPIQQLASVVHSDGTFTVQLPEGECTLHVYPYGLGALNSQSTLVAKSARLGTVDLLSVPWKPSAPPPPQFTANFKMTLTSGDPRELALTLTPR
jgi:hypothetical protein